MEGVGDAVCRGESRFANWGLDTRLFLCWDLTSGCAVWSQIADDQVFAAMEPSSEWSLIDCLLVSGSYGFAYCGGYTRCL